MSEYYECPFCGNSEEWEFFAGTWEEGHRFGKVEPDTGTCYACGFGYSEHVKYPTREQVQSYKESLDLLSSEERVGGDPGMKVKDAILAHKKCLKLEEAVRICLQEQAEKKEAARCSTTE